MIEEPGRKIRQSRPSVVHLHAGGARLFHFTFRDNHRRSPFDGLVDEIMTIRFLAAQSHEEAVLLHSPRVIRDAFHRAINRAGDRAGGNRAEESFELHEV